MRRRWMAAGCVLLGLAAACVALQFLPAGRGSPPPLVTAAPTADVPPATDPPPAASAPAAPTPEIPYESPIDFDALWAENPDICAWIEIPDTTVSYPVVQHPEDDKFYLRRGLDGTYSTAGTLFIELYNQKDFSDPVTVIYGHRMSNGTMFAPLQTIYSDPDDFAAHREIKVYLPEAERSYQVFAAVPYSNLHVLYYHDFSYSRVYNSFVDEIYDTRSIGASLDQEHIPQSDQRMVILSTCLAGDRTRRYLVLAAEQSSP